MRSKLNTTDPQEIQATDAIAEAGRKIFAEQVNKMKHHEAGSRTGEDIESVHQMRVASRKMRSLFKLIGDYYKPKIVAKHSQSLRNIARTLGQIRDLDVLIEDLQEFQSTQDTDTQVIIGQIIKKLNKRRRKYRIVLNALFDSMPYHKFMEQFTDFAHINKKGALPIGDKSTPHQVRHLLPILLHKRLASVRAYETVLAGAKDEILHTLRVEFKQLRYALEFFKPVLGISIERFIKKVKAMQNLLGRINDIVVFTERANTIKRLTPEQQLIIGQYCIIRQQELDDLRNQFNVQWRSFNKRTTQRQFSDALLVLR
jgi:CHAD domain-containing protein